MVNATMKQALEMFQQIKLNVKVSAEEITATDKTIAEFTKDYEDTMNRANNLTDEMEEKSKQKAISAREQRAVGCETSQLDKEPDNFVIQTAFKPESNLGKETTPLEATEFYKQMRSFFEVSHMDRQPATIHLALMRTCVEKELWGMVELHIKPKDKIEDLIAKLSQVHMTFYPQVILQLKFMAMKQADGQTPSNFLIELEKAQKIAKMDELTADQLLAIIALNGIKNDKLKDFILKDKTTVSVEDISNSILKFEAAELTKEGLADPEKDKKRAKKIQQKEKKDKKKEDEEKAKGEKEKKDETTGEDQTRPYDPNRSQC